MKGHFPSIGQRIINDPYAKFMANYFQFWTSSNSRHIQAMVGWVSCHSSNIHFILAFSVRGHNESIRESNDYMGLAKTSSHCSISSWRGLVVILSTSGSI